MSDDSQSLPQRRSAARGKVTLAEVMWDTTAAGAEVAGNIVDVPFAGLGVQLSRSLVQHARRFWSDRAEQRVIDLADFILEGGTDEEREQLLKREFDEADFTAVVAAVASDEEDEKTTAYGNLLRNLVLGRVPTDYRKVVIKTVRALTKAELELARRVYIHAHNDFPTYSAFPADRATQVAEVLQMRDPLKQMAVRSLVSHHLLAEPMTGGAAFTTTGPTSPAPTHLLDMVVIATHVPADLTVESIGRKQRSPLANDRGIYFAAILEDNATRVLSRASTMLFDAEINNQICNPSADLHRPDPLLGIATIVAICISEAGSPIEGVRKKTKLERHDVAVVLLPGASDDPGIERIYTLDLRENDPSAVSNFITWAQKRIRIAATRRLEARRARAAAQSVRRAEGGSAGPGA
ncbi:MAG: hypothetical protein DCC71_19650 [Proteobacteria bacterium]|nr:MAG: hypothetical protein DCC71_19650 [Pseudomonadota bacterium]